MKANLHAPPKPPVCLACLYQVLGQGSKPPSDSTVSCLSTGVAILSAVDPLESGADECWEGVLMLMSLASKAELDVCLAILAPES